jgi:Arc/MetJ-type ribon-helix-helix transcriptional regulator
MKIQLRPEIEALIQKDVQRGPYRTVDEFVEHAVSMLHDQEAWLAENRTEIGAKIAEGFAAAQRGEFIEGDEVRSQLDERKRAWLADQRRG